MQKKGLVPVLIVLFIVLFFGGYLVYSGKINLNKPKLVSTQTVEPSPIPVETSGWKTYTNKDYNFSFDYPSDWDSKRHPFQQNKFFIITKIDKDQPNPPRIEYGASFAVDEPEKTDLDINLWITEKYKDGVTEIKRSQERIGDKIFEKLITFSGAGGGDNYYIKHNNYMYVFSFSTNGTESSMKEYEIIVSQILSSIKFTK